MFTRAFISVSIFCALLFSNVTDASEKRQVLIVPGILGSMSGDLLCNNQQAIFKVNSFFRGQVVPDYWLIDPILNTYVSLTTELLSAELLPVTVPYDWRLSIPEIAERFLVPAILQASTGDKRVDIVAHSMGGLVVRYYLQTYGGIHVRRVVFIGTPHRGSTDTYAVWASGMPKPSSAFFSTLYIYLTNKMKEACGCEDSSIISFLHNGCPFSGVEPLLSVKQLLPTFPFLARKKITDLVPIADMCEQNLFLADLNAHADQMIASGAEFRIYAGTGQNTQVAIIAQSTKHTCGRLNWPDGSIKKTIFSKRGDNRVLFDKSACPKNYIPAFAGIPCISEDTIHPVVETKTAKKTKYEHGKLPDTFKEEIAEFLQGCREGDLEQCYDGDSKTRLVGACRNGLHVCHDNTYGVCDGQNLPREEICNGLDDDCDGIGDDPHCICQPGFVQSCYSGEYTTLYRGVCRAGEQECDGNGMMFGDCIGEVTPALAEDCANNLDDDCDGSVNDGCDTAQIPTFTVDHNPYPEGYVCKFHPCIITHPHFVPDIVTSGNVSSTTTFTITPKNGFGDPVYFRIVGMEKDDMGPDITGNVCAGTSSPCPGNGIGDATEGIDSSAIVSDLRVIAFKLGIFPNLVGTPVNSNVLIEPVLGAYPPVGFQITRLHPSLLNGRYVISFEITSALDQTIIQEETIVLSIGPSGQSNEEL